MGTERGAAPPAVPPTPPTVHPLPPKICRGALPSPVPTPPRCHQQRWHRDVPSPSLTFPAELGTGCAYLGEVPGCQQRADLCPRVSLPVLTIKGQEHPGVKVPASLRGFGAPREPRYPRGNDTPGPCRAQGGTHCPHRGCAGWHREGTRPVPMDVSPRELGSERDVETLPNPTMGDPEQPGPTEPRWSSPF